MEFISVFFKQMALPFLLVFVVTFAILQKSKIFGEGKAQIDSMVALAVGLMTVTFTYQTGVIVKLMGWLSLGVAVVFVFLVLYGFVAGDLSGDKVPKWMKVTFAVLAGLFTAGVVVYVTGLWSWFRDNLGGFNKDFFVNLIVVILIISVALLAVLTSGKKK